MGKANLAPFIILASSLAFADAKLQVLTRRDSATQSEQTGNSTGYLKLVPVEASAKITVINGQLSASIALPKRAQPGRVLGIQSLTPRVTLVPKDAVTASTHFRVDLTKEDEEILQAYLVDSSGGSREPGKRFEPVLEIRGFNWNGDPATAAVIVPTYLEYRLNEKKTDLVEEDLVALDAVYVPHGLRSKVKDKKNWKTDPEVDKTMEDCQILFDEATDALTIRFRNRRKLESAIRQLSGKDGSLQLIFDPGEAIQMRPAARGDLRQQAVAGRGTTGGDSGLYSLTLPAVKRLDASGQEQLVRMTTFRRPAQLTYAGRNYRFNAKAPASNNEMPLYLAGVFTHTGERGGKQKNVGAVDVKLNMSDKLVPLPGFFALGDYWAFAPALFAKMNTTGVVNDENSAVWLLPLSLTYLRPACCTGDKGAEFSRPALRRLSLYFGYRGEAARVTGKRVHGGFAESRFFLASLKPATGVSYRLETILGWEVGKYQETSSKTLAKANLDGPAVGTDGSPVTQMFEFERTGTMSRLHGGVHSTLAFGPNSSVTINYDMRRLLRAETYFDSDAEIKGYFTAYKRNDLPTDFDKVDTRLPFLQYGRLEKGTRRYLDIAYNHQVTKLLDVKFSYTRGEMAPSFQFVNKFEVALAVKILGKDSMAAR